MSLYEQIIAVYPELQNSDLFMNMKIILRDNADSSPQWIDKWEYSKPLPDGMKIGK
jgi:hypothetical protein